MLRVVIVGCGRVFNHYYKIIEEFALTEIKVVACVDKDTMAASAAADKFRCLSFTKLQDLAKEEADVAFVLTPSGCHYDDVRECLLRGLHVLVEKPAAMRLSEIADLRILAKSVNKFVYVGFQNRFNPAVQFLSQQISKGSLGKITNCAVVLRWCRTQDYYDDEWHGSWKFDGGVLNQQAIHHVDCLRWMLGKPKRAVAFKRNAINQLEAEDTAIGSVEFENSALATIEVSTAIRPQDQEASITVNFERGSIKVGGIALNQVEQFCEMEPQTSELMGIKAKHSEMVATGYGVSHFRLLKAFMSVISSGKKIDESIPLTDLASAFYTSELIHALYVSTEKNMIVDFQLDWNHRQSCYLGM